MGKSEKKTQGKTRISDNSQDRAKNPIAQGFDKFIRSSCQKQVKISRSLHLPTLDLSKFHVNVMTGNNEAYQRSLYDPVIQK